MDDIERGSGFIGDDERRRRPNSRRDQHALTQAARQFVRVLPRAHRRFGNADVGHHVMPRAPAVQHANASRDDAPALGNLLADRAQRIERHERVLHHESGERSAQRAPVTLVES